MKLTLCALGLFSLINSSFGIAVGEKARTLRDTALMVGAEKLSVVPRGTEFDVNALDKTRNWVATQVPEGDETLAGWLLRKDVETIPGSCAPGYEYRCAPEKQVICKSTCAVVCRYQKVWTCQNNPYPGNPGAPYWPKPVPGKNCGYVTMKVCQNECPVTCHNEMQNVCACVK